MFFWNLFIYISAGVCYVAAGFVIFGLFRNIKNLKQ